MILMEYSNPVYYFSSAISNFETLVLLIVAMEIILSKFGKEFKTTERKLE
jgi:hypothetical protein